jgi:hypothetical protein
MSVEDRISLLIWNSEAETTVGVPPRPGEKPKPKVEPETPKPEPEPPRPRPETIYFEPPSEPPESIEEKGKPSV